MKKVNFKTLFVYNVLHDSSIKVIIFSIFLFEVSPFE
jgi:hypothetical protein